MNSISADKPLARPMICRRPGRSAAPKSTRLGWCERRPALTVTPSGHITDCNPAAAVLLGQRSNSLSGHAVASLIEHLPLGQGTPGYNLAYAIFNGGAWQQRVAHSADGRRIPIEVTLAVVGSHSTRVIQITLKLASSGQ